MLDYHLHLWPHDQRAGVPTLDQLAAYCDRAAAQGVNEIALTEHFHRFVQAEPLAGWWNGDPDQALARHMERYWRWHATADLDVYVETVLEAKAAGLPVVLGLEVDHYAGQMDRVSAILDGYPFDVLLGSVHWIGAWGLDDIDSEMAMAEWTSSTRGVERAWEQYTSALEELAASGACDVLAHPDLCKVAGHRAAVPEEFYDRMAEAAAASGMSAEVSSAGWRKPAGEEYPAPPLLARFRARGVGVTTASDAHELPTVAERSADLRAIVTAAGYDSLTAFHSRTPTRVPI